MADSFPVNSDIINFLVVYDISTQKASQLAEKFVADAPKFDVILIIGPFTNANKLSGAEELAVAEGDMASSIAQLENIACRVIYLPGESDPSDSLTEQLHLTPNSINLYARRLALRSGLYITGFTETGEDLVTGGAPDDFDRSEESDEEMENVEVKSASTSIKIMKEILAGESDSDIASADSGIFLFSYKFIHTLNHLLFHMGDEIAHSNVNLCIIPPTTEDALRLPAKFGKLAIVVPKSLRNGGSYCTIKMKQHSEKVEWQTVGVEHHTL